MKIKISLFVLFCLFTGKELKAQEFDITGTWTMFEMTGTNGGNVILTSEDQMKQERMIYEYSFMHGGNLKLISNKDDSEELETVEGTWELEGNKLTCGFRININPVDIVYDIEIKDGIIHLKQTWPDGITTTVNSFKRK